MAIKCCGSFELKPMDRSAPFPYKEKLGLMQNQLNQAFIVVLDKGGEHTAKLLTQRAPSG
jgi:hypothetical protein